MSTKWKVNALCIRRPLLFSAHNLSLVLRLGCLSWLGDRRLVAKPRSDMPESSTNEMSFSDFNSPVVNSVRPQCLKLDETNLRENNKIKIK